MTRHQRLSLLQWLPLHLWEEAFGWEYWQLHPLHQAQRRHHYYYYYYCYHYYLLLLL